MAFLITLWLGCCAFVPRAHAAQVELPPLTTGVNDLAAMFPAASLDDLEQRLKRFTTETAQHVVVLTVKALDGEPIVALSLRAFAALPMTARQRERAVLLVVARKDRQEAFVAGTEVRGLLPPRAAQQKLHHQIALYYDGLRPDLGVHGAVHYLFRVLRGDVRVGVESAEEQLESTSLRGGAAGAIFTMVLAPFLAFMVGGLWGIYATQYGVQRWTRVMMGAIFGGSTAKFVSLAMSLLGGQSDALWYFILALAIPFGMFGSWSEFWMAGDWRGIPREKAPRRKPEDNMGI